MRFVAIFVALYLPPGVVMAFSLVLTLTGTILLVIFANSSFLVLQVSKITFKMSQHI